MHERIIQAAIVNHERNQVVVDDDGNLPEMAFSPEHRTYEGTLFAIGRTVMKNINYVSADYRFGNDEATIYQTKPVPREAQPAEPYAWGDCPESIELR